MLALELTGNAKEGIGGYNRPHDFPVTKVVTETHCVKIVNIWSFSGLYFPAFGLNAKRYGLFLRIESECGKMRTRITPNTKNFHAVTTSKKEIKLVSFTECVRVIQRVFLFLQRFENKIKEHHK